MTNAYLKKCFLIVGSLFLVGPISVRAQSEISPQCFDALHDASYATTPDQVRVSILRFESAGCEQNLRTAYLATGGVPPKGNVNARALVAIAYESAKRRDATMVSPVTGNKEGSKLVAGSAGGGVVFSLPRNLENTIGGNAVFIPSSKLSNEMVKELQKSGAFAVQK